MFSLPSRNQFFFLILFYYAAFIVFRILISDALSEDEAEQLISAQKFRWGYGPQPPLYSWIQIVFFKLFGATSFSVLIQKYLIHTLIFIFIYHVTFHLSGHHKPSCVAALSFMLLPVFSWDTQTVYTHTPLAVLMSLVTVYCFLLMSDKKNTSLYVVFSFCIVLGTLTKYNYILFCLSLLLAALSLARFRGIVLSLKSFIVLPVAIICLAPHIIWCINNPDLLLASVGKGGFGYGSSRGHSILLGLRSMLSGLIYSSILLLIFFLRFSKNKVEGQSKDQNSDLKAKLIMRTIIIVIIFVTLSIIFSEATTIQNRWLLPILVFLPVLLIYYRYDTLNILVRKCLVISSILLAVSVPFAHLMVKSSKVAYKYNFPYDQFAEQIKELGFTRGLIITDSKLLGGNMKPFFPENTVVMPSAYYGEKVDMNIPRLILWDGRKAVSNKLKNFVSKIYNYDISSVKPVLLENNYRRHIEKPFASLKIILVNHPGG